MLFVLMGVLCVSVQICVADMYVCMYICGVYVHWYACAHWE